MFTTNALEKRLDLLHLEEYEVMTEELPCTCTYYIPETESYKKGKGIMHVCSKSLIFEDENSGVPLYKFLYRYMDQKPSAGSELSQVTFDSKMIVEIRTNGPASPYIKHYLKSNVLITFEPDYSEDLQRIIKWIHNIFEIDVLSLVSGADPVLEVTKLIMERQNAYEFDRRNLLSINERDIVKQEVFVQQILPLRAVYGFVHMTNKNFYFLILQSDGQTPVERIRLKNISRIFRRRFSLLDNAIEFIISSSTREDLRYYFVFNSRILRDKIYKLIRENAPDCISEDSISKLTYMWQKNEISNYEYLLRLNEAALRSFCDLSLYPVFPWTIIDFNSENIDLSNSEHFRDLSKPIGALNPKRLEQFKTRYKDMPEPKFLYGTHYSTPGYVIGYLVRKNPLYMLKIQSGRFDKPDRLFYSIKNDWKNCYENPAIVKELIPEFYGDDEDFLLNKLDLNLGTRQNGKIVSDVKLPKWAKDAKHYLKVQREALESEYVSKNLHKWIDLIFGYKLKGEAAFECDNVFNYMTYEGEVNIDAIDNPVEKRAVQIQILEYGQTPKLLFKIPHPSKDGTEETIEFRKEDMELMKENIEINEVIKEKKRKESTLSITINEGQQSKVKLGLRDRANLLVKALKNRKAHKNDITCVKYQDNDKAVITTGKDGFIKVSDFDTLELRKSFRVSEMPLSCFALLDEELYVVGGWDSSMHVFNMNYGSSVLVFEAHDDAVSIIHYIKEKDIIVTASWDCTIRFWKKESNYIDESYIHIIDDLESQCTALEISEDNKMMAYGDELGFLYIFSLEDFMPFLLIRSMGYSILDINIDLSYSITVAYHNIIGIFDKTGANLKSFTLNDENGKVVKMKRRQNMVVACTDLAYFFLLDLMGEDILSEVGTTNSLLVEESILAMDFDNDFFKGVSGNGSGEIITFDIL